MRLLYIEDDEIDVLAMRRLLKNFSEVKMDVCTSMDKVLAIEFANYDVIISDSNLPDGTHKELMEILPPHKTKFISGSDMPGFDAWLKPITLHQIKSLITKSSSIDLTYIKNLADEDSTYEKEMIEIALQILPQRMEQLTVAKDDFDKLKSAAHKTKSSFRVCGMNNALLTKIEDFTPIEFQDFSHKEAILKSINAQVEGAIRELKQALSAIG